MYYSKKSTVCGITAWFAFTKFAGEDWPYFERDGCPKGFMSKEHADSFCDYLNTMPF